MGDGEYIGLVALLILLLLLWNYRLKAEIRKRTQAELEMAEAREAAESANRAKSEFLASMSHELRTPMNAVIGYSEMLEEEAREQNLDEFTEDLQRISKAGKHLLRLINNILDLSRLEVHRVSLNPEPLSAERFLEAVAAAAETGVAENANKLSLEVESPLGEIYVDSDKLSQVFGQVLDNAAKFTREGEIGISARREHSDLVDWFIAEVRDTGAGMTGEQLENLFKPFAKTGDASETRHAGTRLGLVISKQYCELMGGTLTVASKRDEGTTVTIRLPVRASDSDETDNGQGAAPSAEPPPGAADLPTVLVIDDDPSVRDLMERLLRNEGCGVVVAATGEDGLKMARRLRPAVITLDVMLPGRDGWTVLSQLKADPDLARIPVIMQTIVDEPGKAFTLGAADHLTKPIDRGRLIAAVKRLRQPENRHILVVEDDIDTREMITRWLRADGWSVHTAANGVEGLERFAEHNPATVILDLIMPQMDGFAFVEGLRQKHAEASARIIVVTAKELTPEDLERLNGNVERIIRKSPGSMEEIIGEVRRHLPARTADTTD